MLIKLASCRDKRRKHKYISIEPTLLTLVDCDITHCRIILKFINAKIYVKYTRRCTLKSCEEKITERIVERIYKTPTNIKIAIYSTKITHIRMA